VANQLYEDRELRRLVELLTSGAFDDQGRGKALAVLTILAGGNNAIAAAVVAAGALPLLAGRDMLRGGSIADRQIAANVMTNLAFKDNDTIKDAVVEAGAIPMLVDLLHDTNHVVCQLRGGLYGVRAAAAGALENLARTASDTNKEAMVEAGAIPPLILLLREFSEEQGRAAAAGVLGRLAADSYTNRSAIIESGAIPPLMELLSGGSDKGRAAAAGTLWVLAAGNNNSQLVDVVEAGALPGWWNCCAVARRRAGSGPCWSWQTSHRWK
jgi:hypothetical protein